MSHYAEVTTYHERLIDGEWTVYNQYDPQILERASDLKRYVKNGTNETHSYDHHGRVKELISTFDHGYRSRHVFYFKKTPRKYARTTK